MLLSLVTAVLVLPLAATPAAAEVRPSSSDDGPEWLTAMNAARGDAGLSLATACDDWTEPAIESSRYMILNQELTHDPVEGNPGYTDDAYWAANTGNLHAASWERTEAEAIDSWLDSPGHAYWVLHPNLIEAGYGAYYDPDAQDWRFAATLPVVDGVAHVDPWPERFTYPGDGAQIDRQPSSLYVFGEGLPSGEYTATVTVDNFTVDVDVFKHSQQQLVLSLEERLALDAEVVVEVRHDGELFEAFSFTTSGGTDTDTVTDAHSAVPPGAPLTLGGNSTNAGTVAGTVTDAETGDPLAPVWVDKNGRTTTTTACRGAYRFDDVEPGTYTVTAHTVGYEPAEAEVEVVGGDTVTIDLALTPEADGPDPEPEDGEIVGTVTDAGSGQPINGATVMLMDDAYDVETTTTAADGTYTYEDVEPGQYVLAAEADGFEQSANTSVTVADGETVTADFALTPEGGSEPEDGTVTGTVTDEATGDPIDGAEVDKDGRTTTTGPQGDYTFDDVEPGTYTVTADADGYEPASRTAEIVDGDIVTVDLALAAEPEPEPEDGEIVGTVTDAGTSSPIDGAQVTLDGNGMSTTTSSDGAFGFGAIAPGTYTVSVDADGYEPASGTAEIIDGDTVTVDLALTPEPSDPEPDPDPEPEPEPDPAPEPEPEPEGPLTFSDVPSDHPHIDGIDWMADSGVSVGYPDGTFRPSLPVERGQMATFMYRLAGEPNVTGAPTFPDVPSNHPHADGIAWMADSGVSVGYPDGTFRPSLPVERGQMATFMHRYVTGN